MVIGQQVAAILFASTVIISCFIVHRIACRQRCYYFYAGYLGSQKNLALLRSSNYYYVYKILTGIQHCRSDNVTHYEKAVLFLSQADAAGEDYINYVISAIKDYNAKLLSNVPGVVTRNGCERFVYKYFKKESRADVHRILIWILLLSAKTPSETYKEL